MKFKVYLIRALLIFIALVIPAAVTTSCSMAGNSLGGLTTVILYAPFLYFIYSVINGKIGPQIPSAPKAEESRPVTPEMLAWDAENSDQDTETVSFPDHVSQLPSAPDTPVEKAQAAPASPAKAKVSRLKLTPVQPTPSPQPQRAPVWCKVTIAILAVALVGFSAFFLISWRGAQQQLAAAAAQIETQNNRISELEHNYSVATAENRRLLSLVTSLQDRIEQLDERLFPPSSNSSLDDRLAAMHAAANAQENTP